MHSVPAARSIAGRWAALAALLLGLLTLAAAPARADELTEVPACPPQASVPGAPLPAGASIIACAGSFSISGATFAHWMRVAVRDTGSGRGGTVRAIPPHFRACITHLLSVAERKHATPTPTRTELRRRCARQYRAVREETLGFLLSSAWELDEARVLKVEVSEAEVQQSFAEMRGEQFPKRGEFAAFLHESGESVADLLFRVKLNLLSKLVLAAAVVGAQSPAAKSGAPAQFLAGYESRWKSRTYCRAGFSAPDCGHVVASL
jgi:hypothetical protein